MQRFGQEPVKVEVAALRESELAARWRFSTRTLQRWRKTESGPPYVWIGGSIRYLLSDIEDYEASGRNPGGSR